VEFVVKLKKYNATNIYSLPELSRPISKGRGLIKPSCNQQKAENAA